MNAFVGIVERAPLQVLKTAICFVAATVATWFMLMLWSYLERELGFGWMGTALTYVGSAAFVGGFYKTFSLFETDMNARKKAIITSLAIMLLTSFFSVRYLSQHADIPAPDVSEFFRRPLPPSPAKPYEGATYDVYSDLFQQPPSLWNRLTSRPSGTTGGLVIVDETSIVPDGSVWPAPSEEFQDRHHSDKASKLQGKFNLPNYVLITKTEEDRILKTDGECLAFQRNYPGYYRFIELSGVDFNRDQTRAAVTMSEARRRSCKGFYDGSAWYYLKLKKNRIGKWRIIEREGLAVGCPG